MVRVYVGFLIVPPAGDVRYTARGLDGRVGVRAKTGADPKAALAFLGIDLFGT